MPLYIAHWSAVPEALVVWLSFYALLTGLRIEYTYPPELKGMLRNAVREALTERGFYVPGGPDGAEDQPYYPNLAQERPREMTVTKHNGKIKRGALLSQQQDYIGTVTVTSEDEPNTGEFVDIDRAIWIMAQTIEEREWLLSERAWSGVFGADTLKDIRLELQKRGGLAEEVNPNYPRQGWKMTTRGKAVMRYVRTLPNPSPIRFR